MPIRLFVVSLLLVCVAARAEDPPRYSRADGYVTAPSAHGLPASPDSLSVSHPGIYADYRGEMFGEGAAYMLAPDQPVVDVPCADWARRGPKQKPLRVVALHRSGEAGTDVYLLGARLGARIVGVPIAFRSLPEPPRGVRVTELTMKRLESVLAEPADVILVNKLIGSLPLEAQHLILVQVEAGAGLVVVPPLPGEGPLMDALGVANPGAGSHLAYFHFAKVQPTDAWLTGGILFDLFPNRDVSQARPWIDYDPRCSNVIRYELKKDADVEVAATIDDLPFAMTGTIGKGRYVHFAYSGNIWDGSYLPLFNGVDDAHALHDAAHYEEQMYGLLAKAVRLAAAGQAPTVRLTWPAGLTGTAVTVRNDGDAARTVSLRVVLRDPVTWQALDTRTHRLKVPAGGAVAAPAPVVPALAVHGPQGERPPLVEYTLRDDDDRPLDWGNTRLAATGAAPLVTFARDVVYPDETVAFTVATDGAATWRAVDTWGREIAAGHIAAGTRGQTVSFTPDRLAKLVTIVVDQVDTQGRLTARTVGEAFTPSLAPEREFYNLVWPRGTVPSYARAALYAILRRQGGIDTVLSAMHFRDNLAPMGVIRGGASLALTNMVPRNPYAEATDWPKTFDSNYRAAAEKYPGWIGRYDPRTIHLQDERHSPRNIMNGFKLSDAALALFQEWLKTEYQNIAALNAEWLSDYQDFAEVKPETYPEEVIQRPESYARYLDLCRWGDIEMGMKKDLEFVRIMDEDTRGRLAFGYEGIFPYNGGHLNPYSGLNLPAFFDSGLNMNNMAYGIGTPTWELCASLNPRADSGTWLGYESPESTYRLEPWRGVLSGATFMGWFIDSLFFTASGAAAPRLSWVEEYTRPLRQGVGRMLNESTRQFDGVAILANMRSAQMAWMYGVQMDPATKGRDHHWLTRPAGASGDAMLAICRDAGISPSYITEGQILGGKLDQFKVLMQPVDLSVDDDVAQAVAAWVERGGVLIADAGAGAYNEHGRRLDKGYLDDVYGIKRDGGFYLKPEAGDYSVGLLTPPLELVDRGCGAGNWYMVEYYEPNLQATTAEPAGVYALGDKTPMCLWNTYGKGRALYLGFLLNRYRVEDKDYLSVRPLIHAAFKVAGVTPRVVVSAGDGAQLTGYTITNFADESILYTGVIKRSVEAPADVVLQYPGLCHVYEVMSNRYLGAGPVVELNLETRLASKAGMPTLAGEQITTSQDTVRGMALLAALPYTIEEVAVAADRTRPGQPLTVQVAVNTPAGPAAGRHVLYLDVRDPDGGAAEPYCRNVVLTGGKGQVTIPLAINELPGTWTLTVREPITGKTASAKVRIKQ